MHPKPPSIGHVALNQDRLTTLRQFLGRTLDGEDRVTLEVGSGHGHYLTAFAAAHPSRFCLGIDIMSERLERAERKRKRAALPNLAFVHASADHFLEALPSNILLDDVIVLFPDPWPKRRHHKHRLIQLKFLTALAAKTLPGARLCFRTDSAEYFASASKAIADHSDWIVSPATPWPFELPTVFQTRAPVFDSIIAIRA